ncbi:hypothetical protein AAMO2058_001498000, partial [Amorphochlora amoebiformis]
ICKYSYYIDDVEVLLCQPLDSKTNTPFDTHRWDPAACRPHAGHKSEESAPHAAASYTHWYRNISTEEAIRLQSELLGFLRQILIHPCTTHLALSLPSVIYHITLALLPISKDKKQYAKEKSEISTVHAEAEKRARRGARFLLEALGPAPGQVIEGLNRMSLECYEFYKEFPAKSSDETGSSKKSVSSMMNGTLSALSEADTDLGNVSTSGLSGVSDRIGMTSQGTPIASSVGSSSRRKAFENKRDEKVGGEKKDKNERENSMEGKDQKHEEGRGKELDEGVKASGKTIALIYILIRWYKNVDTHTELMRLLIALKQVEYH